MDLPAELEPTQRRLLMDLVAEAGIDVSDWSNVKGGSARAAANPKYCYSWSFVAPAKVVVLNLWYRDLNMEDGLVRQELNPRQHAAMCDRDPTRTNGARRARNMDLAIRTAFEQALPVRVVICEGRMRDTDHQEPEPSRVERRLLDPVAWAVTMYDDTTGACVVTRGSTPERFADQFSEIVAADGAPARRLRTGTSFERSAEVRRRVLARARGRCEWCGELGFSMADGRVYLETHHVVPLAEDGPDIDANVVALCPNDHRAAHYGRDAATMRAELGARAAVAARR